jgi:hypothetical protein
VTSRLLLTLGTLGLAAAVYALMLRSWRRRQGRQADLPAPPAPTGTARVLVAGVPGLFVGTTGADDWLDRIAVHRLSDRAGGELSVGDDGAHIARDGLPELFVPLAALEGVTVETALAGKVVSTGMLVLTWRLGRRRLASAFRADDPADHARLHDCLTALIPPTPLEAA